ncbi:asparaginase [Hwanghaeella grinnelliae]|uniref:Asparaginase n=1 Tax=Hwanghaeella grinnelliae TaxID=2500179 RepID=A0A437QP76_9PROT|nr:asparaginase [Hwanghaeella grinnelliae]RVU36338.1 asparaginase [Hwanghaeella grinnelliae]
MSQNERPSEGAGNDPVSLTSTDRAGSANPIGVEVTRGPVVESRHRGSVAIVDVAGKVKVAWGDIAQPVYPRSAIKALQAIPAVESGMADAVGLSKSELALLCSSHGGEPRHTETAAAILKRVGMSEADLECGTHWPTHEESAHALAASGGVANQLHNNCSGKHAGMLALAKEMGVPTKGYSKVTHPIQQRILGVLEFMAGIDMSGLPMGIDGCSIPTWAIPLENLAYAFARFGAGEDMPDARRKACDRIMEAVFSDPFMIAGTGRYCSEMTEFLGGRVFLKTGAEGVFCAAVPSMGIGIALKCDDGASRGAEMLLTAVLDKIGVFEPGEADAAAGFLAKPVVNRNNLRVGEIRPAQDILSF